jgi:hypothetical protein
MGVMCEQPGPDLAFQGPGQIHWQGPPSPYNDSIININLKDKKNKPTVNHLDRLIHEETFIPEIRSSQYYFASLSKGEFTNDIIK